MGTPASVPVSFIGHDRMRGAKRCEPEGESATSREAGHKRARERPRQTPSVAPGQRAVVGRAVEGRGGSEDTRNAKHAALPISEKLLVNRPLLSF